jgi:signal recognition particle GTPase
MIMGGVMAIVRQHDKRSGITYAYESISHWDKEKKQSRAKRTLIGRVDDSTGEIFPTKATNRPQKGIATPRDTKRGPVPSTETSRKFYGATYILDVLGNRLGLVSDLKQCFPHSYKQIISLAYYLILEADSPLSRFSKWSALHQHPHMRDIPSQRSSELFASITEEDRYRFFQLQAARRCEKEYWAYDITSVSSYSENNNNNSIIIKGPNGTGKSTFIIYLYFKLQQEYQRTHSNKMPIYLNLKKYVGNYTYLKDEIKAQESFQNDISRVEKLCTNREIVLLIDGVDELFSKY